jgi:uncharacterized membrane protein YsdA (DUF1294 family)
MKYLLLYLALMNIAGFVIMAVDKAKAKKHKWRIREKNIFLTAAAGGSIGVLAGMGRFHHKTKHNQFVYGIPAILIVQLAAAAYIYMKLFK